MYIYIYASGIALSPQGLGVRWNTPGTPAHRDVRVSRRFLENERNDNSCRHAFLIYPTRRFAPPLRSNRAVTSREKISQTRLAGREDGVAGA